MDLSSKTYENMLTPLTVAVIHPFIGNAHAVSEKFDKEKL